MSFPTSKTHAAGLSEVGTERDLHLCWHLLDSKT